MRFLLYPTILCLYLIRTPVQGQPTAPLKLPLVVEELRVRTPFLYQYADADRSHNLATVRRLPINRWQPVNSVNFGSRSNAGWMTFQLLSPTNKPVWLELDSHFIDSVQVWLVCQPGSPDETITTYRPTGFRSLAYDRDAPAQHPFFLKSLKLRPNVRYAVYVWGWVPPGDILKFEVKLWHPDPFRQHQQRLVAGWALFAGLVLMSVFITVISYAFHPQPIYLYYSGYVLCMSMYAWLNDGWGMFTPDALRWFDSTSRIMHWFGLGVLFLMLFTRSFLATPAKTGRWWLRLHPIWLAMALEGAVLMIDYGISVNHATLVTTGYRLSFAIQLLYGILWLSYIVDAAQRRFRPVWLYAASGLVWLFFYVTNVLIVDTGGLTEPFPDMLVFRLAILFEIGLIFIGWMYRQRLIRESAQQLRAQEQARQQQLFEAERQRQAEELKALRLQNELQHQREQLARDLHDGIGSQLTHIAGRLDILSVRATDERSQLVSLSHFTRDTNQALRDTVWILNRSDIPFPTFAQRLHAYLLRLWEDLAEPQLNWHAGKVPGTDSLLAGVAQGDLSETVPILSPLQVQCLLRITQEAVNNALKHAKATIIRVELTYESVGIWLRIVDDGQGIGTDCFHTGYGLTNMQKRTEEAGGQWTLTSNEAGTTVSVCLPVHT